MMQYDQVNENVERYEGRTRRVRQPNWFVWTTTNGITVQLILPSDMNAVAYTAY